MSKKLESNLKAMYRITCPDAHTLGEYQLGVLTKEAEHPVAAHLLDCPHCRQELASLTTYLASSPNFAPQQNPSSAKEFTKTLIARLVPASLSSIGIRGEQDGLLVYETGGWQITIDIQKDMSQPGQMSIFGLIAGGEFGEGQVNIWQEEEIIAQTSIDLLGNFAFSGLALGKYTLSFVLNSVKIQVNDVIL